MVILVVATVRGPADLMRVPFAKLAGDLLAAGLLIGGLVRLGLVLRPRLDLHRVWPLARRAWPLVVSALFGLLIYNSDLIFIRLLRDREAVGFYAAGYTLVSFLINLGLAYGLSLLPALTRLREAPAEQLRLHHTAHAHVVALSLPIALGGCLLAGAIIRLVFGPAYAAAATALAILSWSVPVSVLRDVSVAALITAGREDAVMRLTGQSAILNLVLNLTLIPFLGIVGAALATVATESVRLVLASVQARRTGLGPPSVRRYGRTAAATVIMLVALIPLRSATPVLSIPIGIVAYAVGLWAVGGLSWRRGERPALSV
jgi:O-antigen/teichoic acid export membrane protein